MEYRGIIYKAYCLTTKKNYIGQTRQDFLKRQQSHINESFNENCPAYNYHFHRAIRKYGINNFEWSILETIEASSIESLSECLDVLEIKYIKLYDSFNSGYNSTTGGSNTTKQCKKVTIYNIDGTIVKNFNSCEEVASYLNIKESKVRDIVTRRQEYHYANGIKYIIRYSDYLLTEQEIEYIKTVEYIPKVYMYNSSGVVIQEFISVEQCSNILNISNQCIISCCRKDRKCTTIDGKIYTFRYTNQPLGEQEINYLQNKTPTGTKLKAINSKTNEIIGIYSTLKEASSCLNINQSSIHQCCKGKRKTGGKINGIPVIWEYVYEG